MGQALPERDVHVTAAYPPIPADLRYRKRVSLAEVD
jgi:hypothetical protein